MEGSMVNKWAIENNVLIKDFFEINLPNFKVIEESAYGPNWGLVFTNNEIIINIKGDIGFHISIEILSDIYPLWQYDRSVNDAAITTNDNLIYQLRILKRFILEIGSGND